MKIIFCTVQHNHVFWFYYKNLSQNCLWLKLFSFWSSDPDTRSGTPSVHQRIRWGFPSPDPFSVFLASSDDITSVYKLLPVQFAWKFFFVLALVVAACVTCCVTDVLVKFPLHSLFSLHLSPVAKQLPSLQPNTIMLYRIEIISRTERQSALMSKNTNECLTRSGTWQQWA